ncbi:MAG: hypothetical protein ACJ76H_13645 [Bacteriovoracaceae bacterium]
MTRLLLAMMMMLSILTVSCGKGGGGSSSGKSAENSTEVKTESADTMTGTNNGNAHDPAPTTVTSTSSVPALAQSFKTNISLMNFTSAQAAKYNKAIAIVKKVVATTAFRSKVLNFVYNGVKQFANNKGLSNSQIYQSILSAAETLKPAKNNTMDLGVKLYYEASTVIGYTNPSITYINVNTKFFNNFTANQVAGNLFHEWLHKIGYDHDSAATAKRPYSVPYAIGYIVRDLGKAFL